MYSIIIKRIFDFFAALFLIICLSPLLIATGLVLFFVMDGSIFFTQERGGYKGKIFRIYKFKTMTDEKDPSGALLPDERRLTAIGVFVRKWSIDELPGLLNVLRGEMSLIGPRPQLAEYLDKYTPEQQRRHDILPGITGWAQVNGRNAIAWERKFELDVWYVDNVSFFLDMKIAFMTIYKVLKRVDINEEGQATVSMFRGTEVGVE
jgi:lipopolysaccharide/colanic/teichoic acid biosynthesis glycosyltransferase